MFRVGMKVARFGGKTGRQTVAVPAIGEPCTVVNVYTTWIGKVHIELKEYPAPRDGVWCAGFNASWFRPITEKKTPIDVFTQILDRVNGKNRELCGND